VSADDHKTPQAPAAERVNAISPPSWRAATISGLRSTPPRSAIATDCAAMIGLGRLANWPQVAPSMMRSTPKYAGLLPAHDSAPPSVKLYEMKTIDGLVNSPAPSPRSATIGEPSTFL
jgi:hypothetical protein